MCFVAYKHLADFSNFVTHSAPQKIRHKLAEIYLNEITHHSCDNDKVRREKLI